MQKYLAISCLFASLTYASEDPQLSSAQEAPKPQVLLHVKDDSQSELMRLKEENEALKSGVQELLSVFKQCSLGDLEKGLNISMYSSNERVGNKWDKFAREIYTHGDGTAGIYHMNVSRRDNFRWSIAWVPDVPSGDISFSDRPYFYPGDKKLPPQLQHAVRLDKGGPGPFGHLIELEKTNQGQTAQQIREITTKLQKLSAKD